MTIRSTITVYATVLTIMLPGCAGSRSVMTTETTLEPATSTRLVLAPNPDRQSVDELSTAATEAVVPNLSSEREEISLVSGTDEAVPSEPGMLPPDVPPVDVIGSSLGAVWTLQSLEAAALQNNPAIAQASASAYKAMGYRDQVGVKPNPIVGYNATQLADKQTDQHIAFVEQDIVTGGKLERNRAVLNQEVQSQLWEVEVQRYRVQTDVRQRFYEALAAQRRLQLATDFRKIALKGVQVAQARVDAKEGSVPEVLQAEIQLTQVDVQRRQAEAAFRGAWNQLMAVTGLGVMDPGVLDGILPSTVVIDLQSIKGEALASSPELEAARARISRAKANVCRQEVQAIPNLSFQLAAGVDNGTDSGLINAQVGLPIPVFNKNHGNISAAHAELNRACQELRRIELAIESRMAGAAQDYESAAAAVEEYQAVILPKAEQTLSLSEEAYEAGEYGFLQVLVARQTYFEANWQFVASQANLAQAEAYLQGLALSGGLNDTRDTELDSGLRDQSLSGQ